MYGIGLSAPPWMLSDMPASMFASPERTDEAKKTSNPPIAKNTAFIRCLLRMKLWFTCRISETSGSRYDIRLGLETPYDISLRLTAVIGIAPPEVA